MDQMQSNRKKLIQLLANHQYTYISSQQLARKLNISQSSIWRYMKGLEEDGYHIEFESHLGYRIVREPKQVSENTLIRGLNTKWLGQHIIHKQSVSSTQTLAHRLAHEGGKHGTVIVADEQTNGKGQMNRRWHSAKNKGIWLSMILKPSIPPKLAPQLTLLTATVLADVIIQHTQQKPQIKWPNDVLIQKKKVAGILTEMQAEQERVIYVIVGIGLNVNQTSNDLAEDIQLKATSLLRETGKKWNIKTFIHQLLYRFEKSYEKYVKHGFPYIKRKWENYGFKVGQFIRVKTLKEAWYAHFLGIAEDGALLVKNSSGETEKIYSAEIDWFNTEDDHSP